MDEDMTGEIIVLRFVHVVGGIFWVGAMFMNSFFLFPTLAEMGPGAGPVMAGLQRRKFMSILPIVAVLTILAGARLMYIGSAGSNGAYFQSTMGRTLATGATAAIIAFLIGILVSRPAAMRVGKLGAAMAKASELERPALAAQLAALNRRAVIAGNAVVVLLLIAAGAMSVARYLG
jgi:hypothetical protein